MEGERQRTGRAEQGIYEIIDYYKALPRIEEAQIQGNWEADYMMLLSQYELEWPAFNTSLIEMVANEWTQQNASSYVPVEFADEVGKPAEDNG